MKGFWCRYAAVALLTAFWGGGESGCTTAQLKDAPPGSTSGDVPPGENGDGEDGGATDGGKDGTATSAPIPVSSAVTIQVQPTDRGAALQTLLRSAKTSVHMTMYLLTDNQTIDALGDLKQAGKDVKVLLNQTFPTNSGSDNQDAYDRLKARKVDVKWAPPGYAFTHAKTIIVDAQKVVIMTMNMTYSSPTENREYIATDSDADDVSDAEKIFAADYANEAIALTTKLVVSPASASPVEPRLRLKALIESAKTSLDVEVQSLSDAPLVDAILASHASGVAVRVVLDGSTPSSNAQDAAVAKLKQGGVPIRSLATPDIHAKAIVVDETRVFVGSQNFTANALRNNREIGVVTDAKGEAAKVRQAIAADFAKGAAL